MLFQIFMIVCSLYFGTLLIRQIYYMELALAARRQCFRDGTHDYYGNKIEKSENNG